MRANSTRWTFALVAACSLMVPCVADAESPRVVIETSKGKIVLELYPDKAPGTVENFLTYVADSHYDGTIIYRVETFLIQAGSTNPDFSRRPTRDPIQNEADNGLKNTTGTVGMARYEPHSATAEFYINTKDNPHLDHREKTDAGWGYCIFGRVVRGMETVRAIGAVERGPRNNWRNVPKEEILITKVYMAPEGSEEATASPEEIESKLAATMKMMSDG